MGRHVDLLQLPGDCLKCGFQRARLDHQIQETGSRRFPGREHLPQRRSAVKEGWQHTVPRQFEREVGHGNSRSEEHTYELQSLMRISYAVVCLKKKQTTNIREQQ